MVLVSVTVDMTVGAWHAPLQKPNCFSPKNLGNLRINLLMYFHAEPATDGADVLLALYCLRVREVLGVDRHIVL